MNRTLRDALLFFVAIFSLVTLFACSDTLTSGFGKSDLPLDAGVGSVRSISVITGFTDTMPFNLQANSEGANPNFDTLIGDGSLESGVYNERTLNYLKRYRISFSEAKGAASYEVRLSLKPITLENWDVAQVVSFVGGVPVAVDGKMNATIQIPSEKAKVASGECTGCGACQIACPTGAIAVHGGKASVDPEKCISCGRCYNACTFDAVEGAYAGISYYIAVRARSANGGYSPSVVCTPDRYRLQFTTVSSIPDSKKRSIDTTTGDTIENYSGCEGNGSCGGCYIINPKDPQFDISKYPKSNGGSVCPVGALYSIGSKKLDTNTVRCGKRNNDLNDAKFTEAERAEAKRRDTDVKAIFIDEQKCVQCGRCAVQCAHDSQNGSVTTEVIRIP